MTATTSLATRLVVPALLGAALLGAVPTTVRAADAISERMRSAWRPTPIFIRS